MATIVMHRRVVPIILALTTVWGCQCDEPGFTRTLPPGAVVDTFAQADVSRLDILWVVDDSESMVEEQANLADNLAAFFRYLEEGEVAYRIGVATTDALGDAGRLVGSPQVLDPDTSFVFDAFQANVRVGTGGSAHEEGFAAALAALERNPELLRPEAWLFVIFVSDEDDVSFGEVTYFWRAFEQIKGIGNERKVSVSAIVGPPDDPETGTGGGCESEAGRAEAGDRYVALAEQTGGLWGSICDPSFAATLEELGALAVGLRRKFNLSRPADPDTLQVFVRYPCDAVPEAADCVEVQDGCGAAGEERAWICAPPRDPEGGWSYEPATHSVFFAEGAVPGLRSVIEVVYEGPK